MINKIFNEDCNITLDRMLNEGVVIDVVLTSPPYNTSRNFNSKERLDKHEARYDIHLDNKTDDEYLEWTTNIINKIDNILVKDGVILWNMSYSTDTQDMSSFYKPNELMFKTVVEIMNKTNFTLGDCIIWKKNNALPNNTSKNKLTRIVEFVYVFVRKKEFKTYSMNKEILSTNARGQNYYSVHYNFIEAKNNDGKNPLNKATFSTEFASKLLKIYSKPNSVIYDCFMGIGTTAFAVLELGENRKFIGSELSKGQCELAKERLSKQYGI